MRLFRFVVLYAGLALMGNPAAADIGQLMSLAKGDLAQIQFHATPKPLDPPAFVDENGAPRTLDAYKGKYVLLNFWAIWCPPCVKEMPALDRLDAAIGGNFEVVTIAIGRNPRPAVDKFFAERNLTNLPKLFDKKMVVASDLKALSLPSSLLIDPEGREIARATGEYEWDSPDAQALINAWISGGS